MRCKKRNTDIDKTDKMRTDLLSSAANPVWNIKTHLWRVGTNAHSTISEQHTQKKILPHSVWVQIHSAFVSSPDKCILSLSLKWCLHWHIASCNYSVKVNVCPEGFVCFCVWIIKREREGPIGEWSPIKKRDAAREPCFQHSSQYANIYLVALFKWH